MFSQSPLPHDARSMRKGQAPLVWAVLGVLTAFLAVGTLLLLNTPLRKQRAAVAAMYEAKSAADHDAYMNTLLPTNLENPAFHALDLLAPLSEQLLGVNLDLLDEATYHDMRFDVVHHSDGYALVRASGMVRLPQLTTEVAYCSLHDIRQFEERWYVDIAAPEQSARMVEWRSEFARGVALRLFKTIDGDSTELTAELGQLLERYMARCGAWESLQIR